MRSSGLAGALLAGGQSSRFGADKLELALPGSKRPVWSAPADALAALTEPLAWVAPGPSRSPAFQSVPDPGVGPLPAIAAALAWGAQRGAIAVLVLAADLPVMNEQALLKLVEAWEGSAPGVSVCALGPKGHREPLCAIYPTCWAAAIQAQVDAGQRKARASWLQEPLPVELRNTEVTTAVTVLEHRQATIHPCFNLNRPEDWQFLQQRAQEEELP